MATNHGTWDPIALEAIGPLFAASGMPWWIAGDWAIDLFLGRTTREHGDVDIAVMAYDQPRLQAALAAWDVNVAASGTLTPWREGDWLDGKTRHGLWARRNPAARWCLEILLEQGGADSWTYRRDARISRPRRDYGRVTVAGLPYIAPEVALLFKSNAPALDRNAADFEAVRPALDALQRRWLADALNLVHPDHPWLDRL